MKVLFWFRDLLNRISVRLNRKITGSFSWIWIALSAFLVIGIVFLVVWLINGRQDTWPYVYAALKINSPSSYLQGTGSHYLAYLIMGIAATFLIPFLTTAVQTGINNRVMKRKEGRKIYHLMCNHYVLIGYNRYATQILTQILSNNHDYAILLTTQNPFKIRENFYNELDRDISKRVIIYAGDALQQKKISKLNLCYANQLYLLDESEPHGSQYSRNLSVLKNIVNAVEERTKPLEVCMQVNNFKAYNLLQRVDIPQGFFVNKQGEVVIDFRPFNFYENWARLLWSYYKLPQYDTLDFEPLEGTNKHVHLVIAGFNSMGRALFLESLRLCHYPNFVATTGKNKTIVTVFDARWNEMKDAFFSQYPNLNEILDIDIDFQSVDISTSSARELITNWACDEEKLLTIAICDKDSDSAMTKALNLPEAVYYQKENFTYIDGDVKSELDKSKCEKLPKNENKVRVLVRQEQNDVTNIFMPTTSMIKFGITENASYPHIRTFGMFGNGLDMKQLDDKIAICINGIYSDESIRGNYYTIFHMLETDCIDSIKKICRQESQDHRWLDLWLTLPENMKWSNRFQADMYGTYISIMKRIQSMPKNDYDKIQEKLSEVEHLRWCAERIVAGWRQKNEGEMRINERRIHKAIISYKDLDNGERVKDFNVIATAKLISDEAQKLFAINDRL